MAKLATGTSSASGAPHPAQSNDRGSQKTSELSSNSFEPVHADQKPPPRRSQSLRHGLASAPPGPDASGGPSSVELRAREHLSVDDDGTEPYRQSNESGLDPPSPREETRCTHKHPHGANAQSHVAIQLANTGHRTASVADEIAPKPVLESSKGKQGGDRRPRFKMLLCGDRHDPYSAADVKRFIAVYLKCWYQGQMATNELQRENIRAYLGDGPIGDDLAWFFDPNGIAPGGLLILFISGHGMLSPKRGVEIKLDRCGPTLIHSIGLHTSINNIQVPCTLELVLGTCNSETVISGLERLLVMGDSGAPKSAQTIPKTLLKSLYHESLVPELDTRVQIIVWAAAVEGGPAYPEADLPNRRGRYDVMIGAMCRALESATGAITRRELFGIVQETVTEYNIVRDEKYCGGTKEELLEAQTAGKYRGPQLACLLSSPGNPDLVLDSPAFVALRED